MSVDYEKELQEFYNYLRKNDAKLVENLGLNRFVDNLEEIIRDYQSISDESAKTGVIYDCIGTIYDMMKAVKNYRLDRGVENNVRANPVNLKKEDLIFRSLFRMYNHLRFSLYAESEDKKEVSNK
ncbi:MAG: hypothetical protein AABW91_01700 [Nanoarchaeota archaeon]